MFRTLGPDRSTAKNLRLAAYLAIIAGTVNSAGFVIIGTFTSHVTGNVGRFADQIVVPGSTQSSAFVAGSAVIMFFFGALASSMAIESRAFGASMSRTSAALLLAEALLIATFIASASTHTPAILRTHEALLLSAAMGVQNALVTRLSGAVIRTTHMTGVVTDLGIEAARWFRYARSRVGESRGVRLTVTDTPVTKPNAPAVALLGTIFVAFVIGSAAGAFLASRFSYLALLPVVALLAAGAVYATLAGGSIVQRKD